MPPAPDRNDSPGPTEPLRKQQPVDPSSEPTNLYGIDDIPKTRKVSRAKQPDPQRELERGDILVGRSEPGREATRYQLIMPLGQGGFGQVWKAQVLPDDRMDSQLPYEVAIKIFSSPYGLAKSELKNRELSAMLAVHDLKTDRVPQVYDWAIGGDYEFVVMQYGDSGSLHELRYRMNMIDEPTAWRLLTDLLTAIKHAHAADILHLDVKPANVLLDGKGGFMLTDFGISQGNFVNSTIQYPGLGTPNYRAPEQEVADEEKIGSRTDLYGIGSTVWAAFCGFDLSSKRCPNLMLPATSPTTLPAARLYREHASEDLCVILDALLARDPAGRPGGAAEVLEMIAERRNQGSKSTSTSAIRRYRIHSQEAVEKVLNTMIDPLWQVLLRERLDELKFARFEDGEYLCVHGEKSYTAFLLLSGSVVVEREDRVLAEETREGTFIGEIATLTGGTRTASVRAKGQVWTCVFNAAELERFVMCNPAVAIRMIRSLAKRVTSHAEAWGSQEEPRG
ncbi:protein kinase [bacterium]|nr:protein kinase [bacterium]